MKKNKTLLEVLFFIHIVMGLPCFQYRVLPAKPLLRLKYSFLENPVGFVWKHITYHYFMQNFVMLGLAVYRPHVFEI